jgi:hypothetical protein
MKQATSRAWNMDAKYVLWNMVGCLPHTAQHYIPEDTGSLHKAERF